MNIRGLYKTSLVDFPGKISTVIFTGGCNLRCGYCHNRDMVLDPGSLESYSDEYVLDFLSFRKNLIDGVTLTGGEPALNSDLTLFLKKIREIGLLIKLDTNGFSPPVIKDVLDQNLADYIALDVKSSPGKYPLVTGRDLSFEAVLETINIMKDYGVDFELRTTCIPGLVTLDDIEIIGRTVGNVKRYFLQQFVNVSTLIDSSMECLSPYPVTYLEAMKKKCLEFADTCAIRGI